MSNEFHYSNWLLTGHTERKQVVMQLSFRLPRSAHNTHILLSKVGRESAPGTHRFALADGKPQQWSLWRPAFSLISWLMYREKAGPLEPLEPTCSSLGNALFAAVGEDLGWITGCGMYIIQTFSDSLQ